MSGVRDGAVVLLGVCEGLYKLIGEWMERKAYIILNC